MLSSRQAVDGMATLGESAVAVSEGYDAAVRGLFNEIARLTRCGLWLVPPHLLAVC
jgi:hypothetical protein